MLSSTFGWGRAGDPQRRGWSQGEHWENLKPGTSTSQLFPPPTPINVSESKVGRAGMGDGCNCKYFYPVVLYSTLFILYEWLNNLPENFMQSKYRRQALLRNNHNVAQTSWVAKMEANDTFRNKVLLKMKKTQYNIQKSIVPYRSKRP